MSTRRLQSLLATFTVLVAIVPQSAWAQEYEVTDLGALGVTNQPWSVNSLGQVAGWSGFPDGHDEGFFFDGNTIDYIGTPGPTTRSDLVGINDLGEAVGKSGTVHENGEALLRRTNGSVRRLGTLGGSRSAAMSINNSSLVVGWSKLPGDAESRPFIWENGVMDSLPLLGGGQGQAEWINDVGQIVGGSTTDTDGLTQFAVIWEEATVTRLPPIYPKRPGLNNVAYYIHDNGDIAGFIRIPEAPPDFTTRGAIWRDGQVHLQLGTLADGTPVEPFASSWASGVNASDVVVGMSVNAQSALVPFVYRNGEMVQLDDLMPDPWVANFVGAGAINDAGQIVVSALVPGGGSHALLLTPVSPTAVADDLDSRAGNGDPGYYLATHGHWITYGIARSDLVTVSLFDVMGRLVARPVDRRQSAGEYEVAWDGRTRSGRRAASGVYFVHLATPGFTASRRLTLVR
jgi:uncharacterized membrane protein